MRRILAAVPAVAAMLAVLLQPTAAVADSGSRCVNDGSLSIKACVYQNYNTQYYASKPYAQLQNPSYRFVWTRLDTRAYVTKVVIRAGFRSFCYSGDPSWCYSGESATTKTVLTPASGSSYYLTPSWVGKWTKVWGSMQYQCGNADVYWTLSGRTMPTLLVPNVCVGSQS